MDEATTDRDLLRDYADCGSESAFQTLVQRHVDLVFATATRRLGDAAAAQEITQDVFLTLARKAAWLRREATLVGWLHKTTLFAVRQWWRTEMRRQRREQKAIELGTIMKTDDSLLKSLAGVLDEGLMELRDSDRQALLLRYFEERSHREIGVLLGANEDAVRKRIGKALDKLSVFFRRRGYSVPAAAIGAALHGVAQAAPAGLASLAARTALRSAGAVSLGGLGLLIAKLMGLTKTQTAALCLLAGAGPMAYEWNAVSQAATEMEKRRIELTELRQTLAGYQAEQERLKRSLRFADDSLAQLADAQGRRKQLAGSIPPGDDSRLYRWSEASEYVRLPKPIFPRIELYDPAMDSVNNGVKLSPALTKDGKVSSVLLATLGLDDSASAQVQQAFGEFAQEYRQLERAHTFLTNTLPDDLHYEVSGSYRTSITSAFPEEGKALGMRFRTAVEQIMGKSRTDALWTRLAGSFHAFNAFGAWPRSLVLHFDKAGSILLTHPIEGSQSIALADVPEQFKAFVEEWKSAHNTDRKGIP